MVKNIALAAIVALFSTVAVVAAPETGKKDEPMTAENKDASKDAGDKMAKKADDASMEKKDEKKDEAAPK